MKGEDIKKLTKGLRLMDYDIRLYNPRSSYLCGRSKEGTVDLAVIFITTEGIQHNSGGVAKHIRSFIRYLADIRDNLLKHQIKLTVYACEPALLTVIPTYNKQDYQTMKNLLASTGGSFFKIINNTYGEDWIGHKEYWQVFSASAATLALNIAERYEIALAISGSTCSALTTVYIHKQLKAFDADIRTIYMTHDSAFSSFYKERNEDILAMDYLCAQWSKFTPNAKIGYVSNYMKELFKNEYMVAEESFIPTRGGIDLSDERYCKLSREEILQLLTKYQIPTDQKIAFTWGRPDRYKRLDLVFQAVACMGIDIYPVAVTNDSFPELRQYLNHLDVSGKFIENYKGFDLIKALLQWDNTYCTCLMSENEPGAISPMEAMLLSGHSVLLANNKGVYQEIITHGENGYLTEASSKQIAVQMENILKLTETRRAYIVDNAKHTIIREYNLKKHFAETLDSALPQLSCNFMESYNDGEEE